MTNTMMDRFEKLGREHGNDMSKIGDVYQNNDTQAAWEGYQAAHADMLPVLERVREALEFYANPSDYKSPLTGGMGKLYFDCGSKSQQALSELEALMKGESDATTM